MKKLLALFTVACVFASCSRSGTTIANDDSAIESVVTAADARILNLPITEKDLPIEVSTAFQTRYPGATNVQWRINPDKTYLVYFFIRKIRWQAVFTPDGRLLSEALA